MKGVPIMEVYCTQGLMTKAIEKELLSHLLIIDISAVDTFFYSGFKQLSEIAIKALSPGINDPGTASESLQALFVLLAYRINHFPNNYISNTEGQLRIVTKEMSFDEIFLRYLLPIWDYGKEDRTIINKLQDLLLQLKHIGQSDAADQLLKEIRNSVLS